MINVETKKKAKKIIKKVEENEKPEQKGNPVYVQQIKTFQNNVAYIGIPKKNIMTPFGLKKGDWVKITLEKMELSE